MKRKSKEVKIGNVIIGGENKIAIQSMTNTDTKDVPSTVSQIMELEAAGCHIVRSSVYDEECAKAFRLIKDKINLPLVADVHFRGELAVMAAENGADKLRINPGNIGDDSVVKLVVDSAKHHNIPIRIGVNGGSLPKDLIKQYGNTPKCMFEAALRHVKILEKHKFTNIVLSVKSSSVKDMVTANRMLSESFDYPLHLGVTEAGVKEYGTLKSAIGIGALLLDGIGDTIRVSLTSNPVDEIYAAQQILKASGIKKDFVEIISCPTCARTNVDIQRAANEIYNATRDINIPLKVAVMGCIVDGPGEAKEADIGIAGGNGFAVIFKDGKTLRKIPADKITEELLKEINKIVEIKLREQNI